jgi:hypothetical protein
MFGKRIAVWKMDDEMSLGIVSWSFRKLSPPSVDMNNL